MVPGERVLNKVLYGEVPPRGLCPRLRVVPHFPSGIVERAKRERA